MIILSLKGIKFVLLLSIRIVTTRLSLPTIPSFSRKQWDFSYLVTIFSHNYSNIRVSQTFAIMFLTTPCVSGNRRSITTNSLRFRVRHSILVELRVWSIERTLIGKIFENWEHLCPPYLEWEKSQSIIPALLDSLVLYLEIFFNFLDMYHQTRYICIINQHGDTVTTWEHNLEDMTFPLIATSHTWPLGGLVQALWHHSMHICMKSNAKIKNFHTK